MEAAKQSLKRTSIALNHGPRKEESFKMNNLSFYLDARKERVELNQK